MYCSLGQWSFRSNDSLALKLVAAYAVNTWTIGRKAFKNVLLEHSESLYVLLGIGGHDLGNTEASACRPLGRESCCALVCAVVLSTMSVVMGVVQSIIVPFFRRWRLAGHIDTVAVFGV
jgi:hypothetical protein